MEPAISYGESPFGPAAAQLRRTQAKAASVRQMLSGTDPGLLPQARAGLDAAAAAPVPADAPGLGLSPGTSPGPVPGAPPVPGFSGILQGGVFRFDSGIPAGPGFPSGSSYKGPAPSGPASSFGPAGAAEAGARAPADAVPRELLEALQNLQAQVSEGNQRVLELTRTMAAQQATIDELRARQVTTTPGPAMGRAFMEFMALHSCTTSSTSKRFPKSPNP